ncbi:MAG: efflux RND transporter periplasmic adaptor subunit [Chromatiales bacterium]|nr:MAG: efflux RND transporter periplasmic adaptor subunit [Chromatiales bacterium]
MAGIGIVAALRISSGAGEEIAGQPLPVRAAALEANGSFQVEKRFIGQVEARRSSDVGFELSGRLAAVSVEEGDTVAAGDLLAQLDTARLAAARLEAEASRNGVTADLALARATLRRFEDALQFEGVSAQELDEARQRVQTLEAQVALAEARINSIDVDIRKSRLTAPYAAQVSRRSFDEGQVVTAGQPVISLVETAAPEVRAGVTGPLLAELQADDEVTVQVAGQRWVGQLVRVLPRREQATRTVDVIVRLPENARGVYPGDVAELLIPQTVDSQGFRVPLAALAEGERGTWTLTIAVPGSQDGEYVVSRRLVEVLHQDGDQAYVRGPLTAGEWYLPAGLQRLVPGQLVAVTNRDTLSLAQRRGRR